MNLSEEQELPYAHACGMLNVHNAHLLEVFGTCIYRYLRLGGVRRIQPSCEFRQSVLTPHVQNFFTSLHLEESGGV